MRKFPKHFPLTDGLCDGTDTDNHKESYLGMSSEQFNLLLLTTAQENLIYVIIRSLTATTITETECLTLCQWYSDLRLYLLRRTYLQCLGTCDGTNMAKLLFFLDTR